MVYINHPPPCMEDIMNIFITFLITVVPFEFSGSAEIYAEYDTTLTADSGNSIVRFSLNPTLKIYGMPLSLDILLSTEASELRQELNKFRLFLEPSKWLQNLTNLPPLFFSISGVEIGRCYPTYSEFTLQATPVTGGALQINPGIFYLATTGGWTQRAVAGSDSSDVAYERMLYAGRLGIGKKEKSHLYFTGLYSYDNENSIESYRVPYEGDSIEVILPHENYVAGVEGKIQLFSGKFSWETELAVSQFTEDKTIEMGNQSDIPKWITDYTHPNMSTSFDAALMSKVSMDLHIATFSLFFKRVGGAYKTLGNEYLINDEQKYGIEATQNIFKSVITLNEEFSLSHNNIENFSASTDSLIEYRIGLNISPEKLPYFSFDYSSYMTRTETNEKQDMFYLSSGYGFELLNIDFSPSLYYNSVYGTGIVSHSAGYSQSVSFVFPLTLNLDINWNRTSGEESYSMFNYGGSVSYRFFKIWTNTIGMSLTSKEEEGRRDMWYASSLDMGVFGNLDIRVENNIYDGGDEQGYSELRIRGSIYKAW